MDRPKIYRFDYTSNDSILHHKYYSCQDVGNALSQFEAGCQHKATAVDNLQIFECQPGCYKWTLVYSRESEKDEDNV